MERKREKRIWKNRASDTYGVVTFLLPFLVLGISFYISKIFAGVLVCSSIYYFLKRLRLLEKKKELKHKPKKKRNVCIVGGGPSGLVALKELVEEGHTAKLYEKSSGIGGLFYVAYEELQLTSGPMGTMFSDFPPPSDLPWHTHWTVQEYLSYLNSYVDHFELGDLINLNTNVELINYTNDNWNVTTSKKGKKNTEKYDRLVLGVGVHGLPVTPSFKNEKKFKGKIMHSVDFKRGEDYKGKNVLVIGIGESSADISNICSKQTEITYLSCRSGGWILPRKFGGLPTEYDGNRIRTQIPKALHSLYWYWQFKSWVKDDEENQGLELVGHLLSQMPCTPFYKGGTKSDNFVGPILTGAIKPIYSSVEKFGDDGHSIYFSNGTVIKNIDTVICCTGYKTHSFRFFDKKCSISSKIRDAASLDFYQHIWHPELQDKIAFLGLIRPYIGSITSLSEIQARYVAKVFSGQIDLPKHFKTEDLPRYHFYRDFGSHCRTKTLINWVPYMDSIADKLGCRPSLDFTDIPLMAKLIFGAAMPAHYRLNGYSKKPRMAKMVIMQTPYAMPWPECLGYTGLTLLCSMYSMFGLFIDVNNLNQGQKNTLL